MSPSLQIEIGALVCYAGLTRDINISGKQASQEPSSSHRKPFSMGFCRRLSSQQVRRRSVLLRLHPSQINCMHSSHCDDIAIRAAPAVSHAGPCDVVSCAQASPLKKRDFFRNFGTISLLAVLGECPSSWRSTQMVPDMLCTGQHRVAALTAEGCMGGQGCHSNSMLRGSPEQAMCMLTRVWSHCRDFHFHHTVRARHVLPGAHQRGQEEPPGPSSPRGVHAVRWAAVPEPM